MPYRVRGVAEVSSRRSAALRAGAYGSEEKGFLLLTRHLFLSAQARLGNVPGYYRAVPLKRDWGKEGSSFLCPQGGSLSSAHPVTPLSSCCIPAAAEAGFFRQLHRRHKCLLHPVTPSRLLPAVTPPGYGIRYGENKFVPKMG